MLANTNAHAPLTDGLWRLLGARIFTDLAAIERRVVGVRALRTVPVHRLLFGGRGRGGQTRWWRSGRRVPYKHVQQAVNECRVTIMDRAAAVHVTVGDANTVTISMEVHNAFFGHERKKRTHAWLATAAAASQTLADHWQYRDRSCFLTAAARP